MVEPRGGGTRGTSVELQGEGRGVYRSGSALLGTGLLYGHRNRKLKIQD